MSEILKIAIWNANGLCQHTQELQTFLNINNIDVMLISETHFTEKSYAKFKKYEIYHTNHPNGRARGGSAIIIRSNLTHHEKPKFACDYLQATSIEIEARNNSITLSAVYCPPRHNNNRDNYTNFFKTLGNRFLAGGDYNAKHTHWGSRLTNTKGRELLATIEKGNFNYLSTGEPTYWPTDRAKIPDLLDFCITKGIDTKKCKIESCWDLSSDHSPIIVSLHQDVIKMQKQPTLTSKKTNWYSFREKLDELITLEIPLKTAHDVEIATEILSKSIQTSAWSATPESHETETTEECPMVIKEMIINKRQLRKRWSTTRATIDKRRFNRSARNLKSILRKITNESVQNYLSKLTPTQTTDYDLWRATKKLKHPKNCNSPILGSDGTWIRDTQAKVDTFAKHLANVFKPWPIPTAGDDQTEIETHINTPFQMELPIKKFKIREIIQTIQKHINPKKSPGFDLITGRILHELSPKCLKLITMIFNAVLRTKYVPMQWKVAQVIMIPKPGKQLEEVSSYRPISLLPVLSKLFEKLLLKRLKPILDQNKLIPNHQFGFRNEHSTIEQVHRIVNIINNDFEHKRYCSSAFLDISQAFDKVWHQGLLYKLKINLPYHYYEILKSYLEQRQFFVKQHDKQSNLFQIEAGVPQGSVLGPILYLLYTSDIPTTSHTEIATYADDTTVLASNTDPIIASKHLQDNLNEIHIWLSKWKIKVNETKSTHVTFTLRRETCPPVTLNNQILPQASEVKYLGIHLDRRLTWHKHIWTKRMQLGIKLRNMYWIIGKNSQLSLENKLLLYTAILRPIWIYGIQLWGSASNSNIAILQRFQNKILRIITNAPWFVPNAILHKDLKMTTVEEEVKKYSIKYRARLTMHPNELATPLMDLTGTTRLKRYKPSDLPARFN